MLIKTSATLKEIIALILMMSPPLINYLLNTDPLIRISEIIAEALGLITIHFTVLVSLVSFSIGILICINLDRK
ncbi:MAG: hypothetical protein QXY40_09440 [Candidatus Methanomethylicia archaeon]